MAVATEQIYKRGTRAFELHNLHINSAIILKSSIVQMVYGANARRRKNQLTWFLLRQFNELLTELVRNARMTTSVSVPVPA